MFLVFPQMAKVNKYLMFKPCFDDTIDYDDA